MIQTLCKKINDKKHHNVCYNIYILGGSYGDNKTDL